MPKLLIVDDSALSRRILKRILASTQCEILEAEEGMMALERYFLEKPDVVLLDLTMSDMHGLKVLAKLRKMDPEARVIIATADIQSSSKKLAHEGGACGFITKPFDENEVLDAVASALREAD